MPKTAAIVAPSSVPFQVGGAEKFWWSMREALGSQPGWQAELIKLPAPEQTFAEIVSSYERFSRLELGHFDLLISTKYPAWMAPHANHICYMQHTLRGLYDTYHFTGLPERLPAIPAPLRDLAALIRRPDAGAADLETAFELCRRARSAKSLPSAVFAFPGPLIREIVHFFDRVALAPGRIKAWLAISGTVAARENYFPPGVPVKVLHHPSDMVNFQCGEGRYFFTASRLNGSKRIGLIIDAMRQVPGRTRLLIAGTGPDLCSLRRQAAGDARIEFLGHVPDADLPGLYAGAIAVPFTPYAEDYGLITLEAFKSGKPVITTLDSGGVRELVTHGENGFVTAPEAPAIGRAMARLASDPALAAAMGEKGRQSVEHIAWASIAPQILAAASRAPAQKVVVACVFPADEHGAGGPRRLYHFCAELAKTCQVALVCIGGKTQGGVERRQPAPGVAETLLPWPRAALVAAEKLAADIGQSADDIALCRHAARSPEIVAALAQAGEGAACAVASHPWLGRALRAALPRTPLLYDAHNVEADLKKALLAPADVVAETLAVEGALCKDARKIFVCSEADGSRMRELYNLAPEKLVLLPNGCEPAGRRRARGALRQRLPYQDARLALFLGSGHKPNVDAALAIAVLARELPDVQFLLAGTVSTQKRVREASLPANAHLLGVISEKSKNALLEAADVALNPVTSGSGVNLKIVEYLAYGVPCVSTRLGMRGMPAGLESVVKTGELADFPGLVRMLLEQPPREDALAATAAFIRRKFAWPQTLAPLGPAIADVSGCAHAPDN